MDTIDTLARALTVAHPLLGDFHVWRRILERAREGSENHCAALRGVRTDVSLRVVLWLTDTDHTVAKRGSPSRIGASATVTDLNGAAHVRTVHRDNHAQECR